MTNRKENMVVKEMSNRGFNVKIIETVKNGVIMRGFKLEMERGLAPVVYNDFFADAETVNQICDYLEDVFSTKFSPEAPDLSWDNVKNKCILCVQKKSDEDLVKFEIADLEGYVRIMDVVENGSVKVTQHLFESFGISMEEFIAKVAANTVDETTCQSMFDMMIGLDPDIISETNFDANIPMWVVTNESCIWSRSYWQS